MKRNLTWFFAGFAASWLVWSLVAYLRARPRDYTQRWQAWERDGVPWMQRAYGRRLGPFLVFAPAQGQNAALFAYPAGSAGLPGVAISDDDQDGKPDTFMVTDKSYRYLSASDKDEDGLFDGCTYSTGVDEASYVLNDNDMDGTYDEQWGPGMKRLVHVDGAWYERIWKDEKYYINRDGRLTRVRQRDGVWSVVGDKGAS